jgi:hypothetical protein
MDMDRLSLMPGKKMGRSQNPNNDKYFSRFRHYAAYFSNYAIVYKDLTAMPPFFSNVVATSL